VTLHNLNITSRAEGRSGLLAMEATARTYRYLDANEVERSRSKPRQGEGGGEEMMATSTSLSLCRAACWLFALVGCSGDQDELTQWMEQQRREVKPNVSRCRRRRSSTRRPMWRSAASSRSAIRSSRWRSSRRRGSPIRCWRPRSTAARSRSRPIRWTACPWSAASRRQGRPYALLRVDNLLYQVKQGDYLGQNYGKITKISETDVSSRNRSGRSRRMDRAHQRPPASGEGAMKSNQENQMMLSGAHVPWRSRCRSARVPAFRAKRDPVDQQQPAGRLRSRPGRAVRAADRVPAGFTVQTPPRIAIDLPGVGNALGKSSVEINQGNLRSVNVAQAGERTRLVLNLKKAAKLPRRDPGQGAAGRARQRRRLTATAALPHAAAARPPTRALRREPEPQRASAAGHRLPARPDGAGRVVVDLPSNQVGVDIRSRARAWWSSSCVRPARQPAPRST
jgi:Tfp pilus assembly protein PilP